MHNYGDSKDNPDWKGKEMLKNPLPYKAMLSNQRGSAILVIVFLIAIMAFAMTAVNLSKASNRTVKSQLNNNTQAVDVARAGLQHAVSWFREKGMVSRVEPNTPYTETNFNCCIVFDPNENGQPLFGEFKLGESNNLWASYTVARQTPDSTTMDPQAVHDVTSLRVPGGLPGTGQVWQITSVGRIFQRTPNQPDKEISKATVSTEIRRINLRTSNAAVTVDDLAAMKQMDQTKYRIRGGDQSEAGIAFYKNSEEGTLNDLTKQTLPNVTGNPALMHFPNNTPEISIPNVFGMSLSDLKSYADFSVTKVSDLPSPYPRMALVVIDPPPNEVVTFNDKHPLNGGGILVINGGLVIDNSATTTFSGLIYVTRNVTIQGAVSITGAVISGGSSFRLSGSGDIATVQYDSGILQTVRQQLGNYRENKSSYRVLLRDKLF